jgi:hypothetical protein
MLGLHDVTPVRLCGSSKRSAELRRGFVMVDKTKYLKKLKELHKQKTGVDLSDSEVLELFEKMVALVEATYKTIPKTIYGTR